jgi:alpha-glucosidase
MRNLDAMGYNAETTDPLYKHIPFYITRRQSVSYGLFYDNLATCWFDLGNELDNYHAWYSQYRAEDGDLDYYMMLGPDTLSVTKRFTRLTGRAIFGPKWSLGYSGSTMHYTDAPNAQEQLLGFVSLCQTHGVPCDSFQLSSGYTSIGDKRYVFNWNHDKVPSPEAMTQSFHEAGFHLAANIKPCLLRDHPQYTELEARGLFVQDSESNDPEVSMFWDAEGSHLDFTNPDTVQWWKDSVTTQLLQKGIDSTWNDNNEYEVWDQDARCRGFGKAVPIGLIRPLMPLLMMRASCEAQQAFAPDLRPFLISRSGCPGMQRYVQTWTGDNSTNWNSIRYNIRMGLGMALSGVTNIGHDVGGFAGPRPDPEMFVRWVQNGVMHPRFTIHSWNDDQTVNEPWMFPEVTPIIRRTIELRYQLLPYIYHQLFLAATEDEPILRPTFLDHEHDARCLEETDDYLFGRDLLVASIVEPGQRERDVYLPDNRHGWYDFYSGQWYAGAQTVRVPAPLERIPLFVRAGAILPLSKRLAYTDANQDNCRILRVYPLLGSGETTTSIFDDDGLTWGYRDGQYYRLSVQVAANAGQINLTLASDGNWIPGYADIKIVLPQQEKRKLVINGQGCENHCKVARP